MKLILLFLLIPTVWSQTNPDLPSKDLLTEAYLEKLTKRDRGQQNFAFKPYSRSYGYSEDVAMRSSAPKGISREIQESDVFKLGDEGAKELFLLNRYRGFQVITFENGVDKPEIKGRFPIYNNWRSEMYYHKEKKVVYVLNTEYEPRLDWMRSSGYITKVYALDTSNTSEPKLISSIEVEGSLSNSRMVGDVLYLVTDSGDYQERRASISSIVLDKNKKLDFIESKSLTNDNRYVRTMNTLQVGEKYYVLVSSTNWRDPSDRINAFDITSPEGKIEKVLTAQAKGRVTERSQVFIHKNYLFMVSNYQTKERSDNPIWRIAVEAVPFSKADQILVPEKKRTITVGDTNGLSAQLEDVRVADDLLYTFWVPVNRIDPFDLFDISNPKEGISHQGQLQFPGWISKAFPLTYKGEKYVLGLGGIVPSVNNESNDRYPQAKLFKIEKTEAGYKHSEIDTLTIEDRKVWARLNQKDKYFEFMNSEEGKYQILFPVYFGELRRDGAQLINVDMDALKLSAGNKIVGSKTWLKRVFLNDEVKVINAFSDKSLESFDKVKTKKDGIAETLSILELARNIIDYKELPSGEAVQVVASDEYSLELRLINSDNSDAELKDVIKTLKVDGKYEWHKFSEGKMYVLSSFEETVKREMSNGRSYDYNRKSYYQLNEIDLRDFSILERLERFDLKYSDDDSSYKRTELIETSQGLLINLADQFALAKNGVIRELSIAENCKYFFAEDDYLSFSEIDSELYAFNAFEVQFEDDKNRKSYFYLPYMKKLELKDSKIECSASINVPGMPISTKNGYLITEDGADSRGYSPWFRRIDYNYSSRPSDFGRNSLNTITLKIDEANKTATIADVLNNSLAETLYGDLLISYDGSEGQHRLEFWNVDNSGRFYSRSYFIPDYYKSTNLVTVVQDEDEKTYVVIKNDKKLDFFEIDENEDVRQLEVTSKFDKDSKDNSAEFVFGFRNIRKVGNKFIISQGLYGVTEVTIK